MLIDRVRDVTRKARLFARVLWNTGAVQQVRPAGAWIAVKTLATGSSGPAAIFRVQSRNVPDRAAFVFEGRVHTYREVDQRIDRIASGLRGRGLDRKSTALIVLHNRPECIELSAALSCLGASSVEVSWRSTAAELTYLASHSNARAVFFEPELWPVVESILPACPGLKREFLFAVGGECAGVESLTSLIRAAPAKPIVAEEGKVIIYTSGTTGKPKGAVREFGTGQIEGFVAFLGETPVRANDRHLCVCPLYHSTGLGFTAMTLMLGGTVFVSRDFDPERFLDVIQRERITTTAIVPTMLHRLMSLPDEVLNRYDTRSLTAVFCGGAQLPGPLALRAMDRLGPVLYNFYGATETGLVTLANSDDLRIAPGTIGRVVPGSEIRLLDEDGREVREGEVGELYVRNAMLVTGYHADDAATRASMRDGFFSVGDLARVDSGGRYHLVGRRRDMVISGGVNVYPVEIESVIEKHPDVSQIAVIGVPDDEWGERLRAFVVPRPGSTVDANELRSFCKSALSGAKIPREWVFLSSLPSNATGKILKRELRDWSGEVIR